jgi:asparagine synthase (glutamine-hydrolysing)
MCGIAGFVGVGDRRILTNMMARLRHRGPDAEHIFISGAVGLAHTRLSIIDISDAGMQPMLSNDKSVAVIFNGEIYNFHALRKKLLATGKYRFASNSDTEVIVYAYQEYGEECFSLFNGMFAIAIYDFTRSQLLLARDRAGEKPLFWSCMSGTFVFASEMKSVFAHPCICRRINILALNKYLQFSYVPTPSTLIEGMYKLEPGTYLKYVGGKVSLTSFWEARYTCFSPPSFDNALKELDKQLEESVVSRLVADVPLGIFLSGGLDSSTVAYYAQRFFLGRLKSFSIGFVESSFDESSFARLVAVSVGTEHYEYVVRERDMVSLCERIIDFADEPSADPSAIPTYFLSKYAREHVKTTLGGDGADELFAGYSTFTAERYMKWFRFVPHALVLLMERASLFLPIRDSYMSFDFKIRRFLEGAVMPPLYRHPVWLGSFNVSERAQLFRPSLWEEMRTAPVFEDIDRYAHEINADTRATLLYQYFRTYLMDQVLVKVDRASMSNGLEVRAPFLDHRLISFVNQLPYEYKYRRGVGKYILRALMKNRLPDIVLSRKKKGFAVPLAQWLRGDLRSLIYATLAPRSLRQHGFFNEKYVQDILYRHCAYKENNAKKIWTLFIFQVWYNHWFTS